MVTRTPPISRATISAFLEPWIPDARPKMTVVNDRKKRMERT